MFVVSLEFQGKIRSLTLTLYYTIMYKICFFFTFYSIIAIALDSARVYQLSRLKEVYVLSSRIKVSLCQI